MSAVTVFLAGLVMTMGVVFLALLYLRRPLRVILTELCGTAERARFWAAFSNITLSLVPFALALDHPAGGDAGQPTIFVISGQMESAIIGFVVSVVVLGFILSMFIARINSGRIAQASGGR